MLNLKTKKKKKSKTYQRYARQIPFCDASQSQRPELHKPALTPETACRFASACEADCGARVRKLLVPLSQTLLKNIVL